MRKYHGRSVDIDRSSSLVNLHIEVKTNQYNEVLMYLLKLQAA